MDISTIISLGAVAYAIYNTMSAEREKEDLKNQLDDINDKTNTALQYANEALDTSNELQSKEETITDPTKELAAYFTLYVTSLGDKKWNFALYLALKNKNKNKSIAVRGFDMPDGTGIDFSEKGVQFDKLYYRNLDVVRTIPKNSGWIEFQVAGANNVEIVSDKSQRTNFKDLVLELNNKKVLTSCKTTAVGTAKMEAFNLICWWEGDRKDTNNEHTMTDVPVYIRYHNPIKDFTKCGKETPR